MDGLTITDTYFFLLNSAVAQHSMQECLKIKTYFNAAYLCCPQDSSLRGIFHYSGKEQMTKYEIACAIADAFNLPSSHLIPVSKHTEDLK